MLLTLDASAGTSEQAGERLSAHSGVSLFIPTEQQVKEFLGQADVDAFKSLTKLQQAARDSSISQIAASLLSKT